MSARSSEDKRAHILDAAIEVFAERGFHHARIADVAERAGVAAGTIYNYFTNKEDLLLSIFEEKMDLMVEGLDRELDGVDDPLERVRRFVRYHFRQVRENPRLAEVLQVELRLSHKFIKEYRPTRLWEYLGRLGEAVREGQRRGCIPAELDPLVVMWAVFGAVDELAMQWALARRKERFNLDRAADTVSRLFLGGLAVGSPEPPCSSSSAG